MLVQAPLVDRRTYDDIVRQATELAESLTCREVEPKPENLRDQVLAEEVNYSDNGGTEVAQIGTVVTDELSEKISKTSGLSSIKIKGWQPGSNVKPTPENLRGQVLAEEVEYSDNGNNTVARIGTVVDEKLAQKISTLGLSSVRIKGGKDNPGEALIHIFARMAEQVIERLNQAPEKNFRAFLDLIGTRLAPPQPARAPLTFSLAEGSTQEGFVPAGTQVAAATEAGEIIFETERDLVVIPARLARVFVYDPVNDRCSDRTAAATSEEGDFTAFEADANHGVEHSLYLACDEIFGLPGKKKVVLTITWNQTTDASEQSWTWSYSSGEPANPWPTLSSKTTPDNNNTWTVTFENPPVPVLIEIDGKPGRWIRLQPKRNGSAWKTPAQITGITARMTGRSGLAPDFLFCGGLPADPGKSFYPFGEKPRTGERFYLASQDVFSQANAQIALELTLDEIVQVAGQDGLQVVWEARIGEKWSSLAVIGTVPGNASPSRNDDPAKFLQPGKVQFTLSKKVEPTKVGDREGYWIRAMIQNGHYGKEQHLEQGVDGKIQLVEATLKPPLLASVKLGYEHESPDHAKSCPLSACLTYNGLSYEDQTEQLNNGGAFQPFTWIEETQPSLYLGFDRPLPNRPVALYVQVKSSNSPSPPIAWEYGSKSGKELDWKPLDLQGDDTCSLTQSGLITFIGPHDLAQATLFGQNLYWLRVRPERSTTENNAVASPVLKRLLTNTTWTSQAATVRDEILGSGTGEPDQVVRTARAPVLAGQQIEVREPESPGAADRADIEREEGADAISAAGAAGAWVRWHEVTDFYASKPRSRHYTFDHLTGEVRFGDGKRGLAPPQGRGNIRAARYRIGGGSRGNLPAGAITQLKSTFPYVAGVTNWAPAGGGADQEDLDRAKERGPKALRHRGRAVTLQDFEDLAYEASPEVARACAIGPNHKDEGLKPGEVKLVIVPRSVDPRPSPSADLCRLVQAYVEQRCSQEVKLAVVGPEYIIVTVTANIVATKGFEAAHTLPATARAALQRFLHPLTGGFDQRGWAFGGEPRESDLYRLLHAIAGVDNVLSLGRSFSGLDGSDFGPTKLVTSGDHEINLA